MENLRDTLNSFTKEDYETQKVNLHIHTKFSDGLGDYKQILNSAKEKNYKLIAITDHNTIHISFMQPTILFKYLFIFILLPRKYI